MQQYPQKHASQPIKHSTAEQEMVERASARWAVISSQFSIKNLDVPTRLPFIVSPPRRTFSLITSSRVWHRPPKLPLEWPPRPHLTNLIFSSRWRPRPMQRHTPSDPAPPTCPPGAFLCFILLCHTLLSSQEGAPTPAFSEPPAPPFQSPYPGEDWASPRPRPRPLFSLWRSVHAGSVAFLWMVCDQWCHRRCSGIYSLADYRRLAPWSCPTSVPPAPPPGSRSHQAPNKVVMATPPPPRIDQAKQLLPRSYRSAISWLGPTAHQ